MSNTISGLITLAVILLVVITATGLRTIDQAHVGVVTLFGKYRRVINPGLNLVIPLIEKVRWKVPVM